MLTMHQIINVPNNLMSLSNAHYNVKTVNGNTKITIAHFLIKWFVSAASASGLILAGAMLPCEGTVAIIASINFMLQAHAPTNCSFGA